MTKKETITFEINHCGECSNAEPARKDRWKCLKKRKLIPDLWGDIPEWCPLSEKPDSID